MTRLRAVALLCVLLAALVFAWSVADTSSARIQASTESTGLFSAAVVTLDRSESSAAILLDAEGLYPGKEASGCVEMVYNGSIPAVIRLHGAAVGGTGLEDYLDVTLRTSPPGSSCADTPNSNAIFQGRLSELWRDYSSYDRGLTLADPAQPGDRLTIRASATVVDDNRAQGLDTDFSVIVEARP